MKIEIYPLGGNAHEANNLARFSQHSHAVDVASGKVLCGISGHYLCWDSSIEDQSAPPSCPKCAQKWRKIFAD